MVEGRAAMASAVYADLVDRLGRARVQVGDDAKRACGLEAGARDGPLAVVQPAGVEQVEHIVKVGRLRHVGVAVRGQLPAAQPDELRDLIVLDTSGLQRTPAVDIGRRVVTAGVGITAAQVDRAARQARLSLRSLSALDGDQGIGALLGRGDPGELGLAQGSLLDDVVGATVVVGSGRVLSLGAADALGMMPWLAQGLGHPLGQLLGSEGRLAVLCEVSLRLQPAPAAAWISATLPPSREALLAAASLGRALASARLVDSCLISESAPAEGQADGEVRLDLRLVTWRGDADLNATAAQVQRLAAELGAAARGIALGAPQAESRRVKLGMDRGLWPQRRQGGPSVDLQLSWPDLPTLLDLTSALYAEAAAPPQRLWALGSDSLRLRCWLGQALKAELHPLVQRAALLFDAGAVPVGVGSLLRTAARDRMPTNAKVLMAALQRAWDPEGVLATRVGLL